jgi:signal peptidase II
VIRNYARLGLVAVVVLALDQWTKQWASRTLQFQRPVEIVGEFVRFTYTRNSGVAFGIGAGLPFPYWVFSIAAVAAIVWLFARRRVPNPIRQLALALILGGAIGNLVDRVRTGEVVDFVEIGYGRWHWPVFNVADSAVTIGVILFALTWPRRRDAPAQLANAPGAAAGPQEPDDGSLGAGPEPGGAARPLPRQSSSGPVA